MYFQYMYFILEFFVAHETLTEHFKKRLVWILHPLVRDVIALRALFADKIMGPLIKEAW